MAFGDAFHMSYVINNDLHRLIGRNVPLTTVTDSLSLLDIITRASITAGRRLMIDLETVKGAYKRREIEKMGFIRTAFNPADALTKARKCFAIDDVMTTGTLRHSVEHWVARK